MSPSISIHLQAQVDCFVFSYVTVDWLLSLCTRAGAHFSELFPFFSDVFFPLPSFEASILSTEKWSIYKWSGHKVESWRLFDWSQPQTSWELTGYRQYLYVKNEFLDCLSTTLINDLIKCDNDKLNVCN